MKCPTCPISMCYHDTMEPEGGGQDKAKELLARNVHTTGKAHSTNTAAKLLCSGERLFLLQEHKRTERRKGRVDYVMQV